MGVLGRAPPVGTFLDVRAKGERAEECVAAVGTLIASRFGEPE